MRNFQYSTREYIPSVDLNILGKTYDTLEQGHKDAVKVASDLEVTMANLELNEAENEWRQQKINDIKQTIADNTIYGNSYAALDNLIMQAGDLAADQGMIGRLQAQKDFKAFQDRVEKDSSLPQDYKDYYLENNPYHYEDKFDKDGKIIGGTKWTPNTSPTNVIPLSQLIVQGIQIAAKESGSGTMTRWLDEEGNITLDPSKAFDGQVYNITTNQWERLGKDKIWKGIRSMIASTPGAKESIRQDYDVAVWKHDKQVKENGDKPFVSDITDDSGRLLTEDEYLFKRVDPAAQAAAYYNSHNNTTYGNGLATYRAAATARAAADQDRINGINEASARGISTPIEFEVNRGQDYIDNRNNTRYQLWKLFKDYAHIRVGFLDKGDLDTIDNIKNKRYFNELPPNLRPIALNLVREHNDAVINLRDYIRKLSPKEQRLYIASMNIEAGGVIKPGKSKFGDDIINITNNLFGKDGQTVVITLSDKTRDNFNNIFKTGNYKSAEQLGIKIDGNDIIIPRSAQNSLPLIASIFNKAETLANKGFINTIEEFFGANPSNYNLIRVFDKNNKVIRPKIRHTGTFTISRITTSNGEFLHNLGKIYDSAVTYKNNLNNINGLTNTINTSSLMIFDGNTFIDNVLLSQYNKGIITKEQLDANKTHFKDITTTVIKNTDYTQLEMYRVEGAGTLKKVTNSGDRRTYGNEIINAEDKDINIAPAYATGGKDSKGNRAPGYVITIRKNGASGEDDYIRYYIPGLIQDSGTQMLMNDTRMQALDMLNVIGPNRNSRQLTDKNICPNLGDAKVKGLGNDMYSISLGGSNRTVDKNSALNFVDGINTYIAIKNSFLYGGEPVLNSRQKTGITTAATYIGNALRESPDEILNSLLNDINKE